MGLKSGDKVRRINTGQSPAFKVGDVGIVVGWSLCGYGPTWVDVQETDGKIRPSKISNLEKVDSES